jgi:hypothetical protein
MGYAARRNPTAQRFADPRLLRQQRETAERVAANARREEFDRLVAAVNAPGALRRFGVGRLNAARAFLANRPGAMSVAVGEAVARG